MSKAIVFYTSVQLQSHLIAVRLNNKSIGFVPTMGALHEGHMALVARAKEECDLVVVSIFVNPTQFNNPTDLEKYPRMPEKDVEMLSTLGEIIVFIPTPEEIYPENNHFPGVQLGLLDSVLEGKFRAGHFKGVTHVVYNLFAIVQPQKAYFGKKDYQQVAVIREMIRQLHLPVELVACATLRESSGLAKSSRNMRLSSEEKEDALIIIDTLRFIKLQAIKETPSALAAKARAYFAIGALRLEYLEIIDGASFETLTNKWVDSAVCCIAAHCGEVRLIDNLELFSNENE
ncbi:MAG: pantoate--beta-alanine ligase [Bacteroidota bacterium]